MTLHQFRVLLAQTTAPAAAAAGSPQMEDPRAQFMKMILMMGGMFLLVYLFMIRPQQKRAKELEATVKGLHAGDKIVTNSGIVGVVLSLKERTMTIRSSETKLEILKSSVAEVTKENAGAEAAAS